MAKISKIFLVAIIILLIMFSSEAPLSNEATFQNTSQDYSTWVIHSNEYMSIKAQNNSLFGFFNRSSSNANKWLGAYAEKPIKQAIGLQINLDFQFNFKEMGEIFLSGFDTGTNSSSWAVGYLDGWSGPNGVPFTFSYQVAGPGGYSPQSYPVDQAEQSSMWISSFNGTGHISIYYTSADEINATVTVPGESLTRQLPLATSIDEVRIYMRAVGAYNTPTDVWKTYNYQENTGITSFSYVNAISPSNISPIQQTNDILLFLLLAGTIIIVTAVIILFSYNKNKQTRINNLRFHQDRQLRTNTYSNSQNPENASDGLVALNENICPLCGYKALPQEKFCRSCGSRLNNP